MTLKLGDVIEYVDGSCFLIGEYGKQYRISYGYKWELSYDKTNDSLSLEKEKALFNIFDVMAKVLGGGYATKN